MNVKGIIPALITPFDQSGNINYKSLRQLVNHLIGQKVGGFYVCGSTAECFLLEDFERKEIIEAVTQEVNGRVPVIAHIGSVSGKKAADFAKHAASCGVTAVSSVPPFYYKFSFQEIVNYYSAISSSVDKPLIIYSIPAFSGVTITAENISGILEHCNAKGLKYTSYDLFELEKISRRYPALQLYNGHDEVFCNALPVGLAGAIGSTFNFMAPKYMAILERYIKGDPTGASALQKEVNEIIEILIKTDVIPSIKYLLSKSGIPCGESRAPFLPLNDVNKAILDHLYAKLTENDLLAVV